MLRSQDTQKLLRCTTVNSFVPGKDPLDRPATVLTTSKPIFHSINVETLCLKPKIIQIMGTKWTLNEPMS